LIKRKDLIREQKTVAAVALAAGILAPWGINMPAAVGALVMSLSTIIVVINAQTLRRLDLAN